MLYLHCQPKKSVDKNIDYPAAERIGKMLVKILTSHPDSTTIVDSMSKIAKNKSGFQNLVSSQIQVNAILGKIDIVNFLKDVNNEFASYHRSRREWYKQFAESVEVAFIHLIAMKYAANPKCKIYSESTVVIYDPPILPLNSPKPFDVIAWLGDGGEFMEIKSNIYTHVTKKKFIDKLMYMNDLYLKIQSHKRSKVAFSVGTLSKNPMARSKIDSILRARGQSGSHIKVVNSINLSNWMTTLVA